MGEYLHPEKIMDFISYSYPNFSFSMLVKRAFEVNSVDRTALNLTVFGIHSPISESCNEMK